MAVIMHGRRPHRCLGAPLVLGCLATFCAVMGQAPPDAPENPYKKAPKTFRQRSNHGVGAHGNATLESALERAPKQCHEKLRYQYERITTRLKVHYTPDPIAALKCTPEALQVVNMPGADLGKLRTLPERSDTSTHRGMFFENIGAGAGAGSGGFREGSNNGTDNLGPETPTSEGSGWGGWPYSGARTGNQVRGHAGPPIPQEVLDAGIGEPMAFFIVVHNEQTPASVQRLVLALNRSHHSFLLHVDGKADEALHQAAAAMEEATPNLRVLRPAHGVAWGGPSLLQVQLEGMQLLVEWGRVWRHWLFLSGSDYPIKSVDHMANALANGPPVSHFEIFHQIPKYSHGRGLVHGWVECENYVYKVSKDKPLPKGMDLWGGSAWITPSYDFSAWLADCLFTRSKRHPERFFESIEPEWDPDVDDDPMGSCRIAVDFLEYSENLMSAEELYVHTVFMNSEHCVQVDPRYFRWVNWKGDLGKHCNRADWCGMSPLKLGVRDLRTALQTDAFFARKFDKGDIELLDMADSYVDTDMFLLRLQVVNASGSEQSKKKKPMMGLQGPIPFETAALDGNEYTAWDVPDVPDAFFRVDMEKDWDICGITLTTTVPGPRFTVQAWTARDPNLGWYELLATPGQDTPVPPPKRGHREPPPWYMEHIMFPPRMARSIIVFFGQTERQKNLQVYELQAHGCPNPPPQETINAMDPASQDQVRAIKAAARAFQQEQSQRLGPPPGHHMHRPPHAQPPPGAHGHAHVRRDEL